jgi:hypothetical protein
MTDIRHVYDFTDSVAIEKLHAAIVELNTYADHTHSCKVGETGDHDDCDCGYNAAQEACGVGHSSSTSPDRATVARSGGRE